MIRRLMASTAVLALVTAGAFSIAQAESPTAAEQAATTQVDTTGTAAAAAASEAVVAGEADATLTPEEPTIATAFIGTSVYSSEDPESDNIGEVNDLIIGDDGMITHAVVGVGGFLGIGEKDVTVPFDELQVIEQDGDIRLIYAATREQLEAAEEFDRTAYDPRGREAEEQAMEAEQQAAQDQAALDTGLAPAEEPLAPAEDMAVTEEPAEDLAAAPAEEPVTEEPATTDMAAAEDPAATTETAPAEEEVAAATETDAMPAEGFVTFAPEQIRASTLIGQEVFGPDDQSIGEISDLVLQEDGETRSAIVDVGGFLGVGEKPVAIAFDQIQFSQEGEEARVAFTATQEELEQLPAFEFQEDVAATDTTDTTTEEPEVAATEEVPAEGGEGAAMTGSGFEPISQDVSAAELLGSVVYGQNDENIGEVNDVVFDASGTIEAVLVDVGGFLGIGEKQVALQFDTLNVQEDESGDLQLWVDATQEQLEGAVTYEETAAQ